MSHSDRDHQTGEESPFTAFTVVWNTVLPALAVALLLDAPMGLAFAVAAVATIAIVAAFAPQHRRRPPRRLTVVRVAPHQVVRPR